MTYPARPLSLLVPCTLLLDWQRRGICPWIQPAARSGWRGGIVGNNAAGLGLERSAGSNREGKNLACRTRSANVGPLVSRT